MSLLLAGTTPPAPPFVPGWLDNPQAAKQRGSIEVVQNTLLVLLSTAVVASPFVPFQFDNPQQVRQRIEFAVPNLLGTTLAPVSRPFVPVPFENPTWQKRVAAGQDQNLLPLSSVVAASAFAPGQVEALRYLQRVPLFDAPNLLGNTLAPVVQSPFGQWDWPVPLRVGLNQPAGMPQNVLPLVLVEPYIFPLGGLHKHYGRTNWRDETPEQQNLRRIASGLIEPAKEVVRQVAVKIANDEQVGKELEQEFYRAAAAQYENEQLIAQIWAFELQRLQDDEDAAVILLL